MNKEMTDINETLSGHYTRVKEETEADPVIGEYVIVSRAFEKAQEEAHEAMRMVALGWAHHPARLAKEAFHMAHPDYGDWR